jgi:hypothetical protein
VAHAWAQSYPDWGAMTDISCRDSSGATGAAHGDEDRSVHGAAVGGSGCSNNQFPPGADDSLASLLPSAAELGLSMAEERPNARK